MKEECGSFIPQSFSRNQQPLAEFRVLASDQISRLRAQFRVKISVFLKHFASVRHVIAEGSFRQFESLETSIKAPERSEIPLIERKPSRRQKAPLRKGASACAH